VPNVTTCTECGKLYEAGSEEQANEVSRWCPSCRGSRSCVLCRCEAVARRYGYPVCTYHLSHGESDPPCRVCGHPPQ
jgi:hypothetical protein